MDSQSVKTVEESAGIRGYDAHKCVKGRKRHLLVDTLGLPLSFYVTPANVHDTVGVRCLLAGLAFFVPRLKKIWADQAYQGHELAEWCKMTAAESSKWSSARQGCAAGTASPADGSLYEHLLGCPQIDG
jgi:putative transposase